MAGPLNDAELSKLRHRVTVASGDVLSYNEIIIRELLDTIDDLKADPVCRSCGKPIARACSVCKRLWES